MSFLLRAPHGFLRRHLSMVERSLVAAGLAILLYWLLTSLPVYPRPWEVVIAVSAFFILLWSPPAAYFLVVVAALYPLYTLSLYVAVLFLAVALLGQRVFIHNLGATLLVLLAPWLAQFNLAWLAPVLGGLWWGRAGGAWIGGLAALWGELLFGMCGLSPDWLAALGAAPSMEGLAARFQTADSLETMLRIVTPLAPNPTLLLYHLLQIILWAMVGGLVGGLAERSWAQPQRPLRATALIFAGTLGLLGGHLGLAAWLEQYSADRLALLAPRLALATLAVSVAAAALETLRDFVEHPLPVPAARAPAAHPSAGVVQRAVRRLLALRRPTRTQAGQAEARAETYQPLPVPPELPRRDAQKQKPDDIIKIELD
jgi:hypothetical protein